MKKKKAGFRPGRTGACETLLYEFAGRIAGAATEAEPIVERVAAAHICEGLGYLRRRQPDFEVTAVQYVGLITQISGSPRD